MSFSIRVVRGLSLSVLVATGCNWTDHLLSWRFEPTLTIASDETSRDLGVGFFGGLIHSHGDDYVFDYHGTGHGGARSGLYQVNQAGAAVLLDSPNLPGKPISLESCGMSFSGMPPLFAPSYRWDATGNRIALTRDAEYDIGVYEGTRLVRRIRREIPPRPATAELAAQDLGEGMKVRTEGRHADLPIR
ncbi:MAG: hypothetical protein WEE89_00670 [Gemmatimonadota bacterium]